MIRRSNYFLIMSLLLTYNAFTQENKLPIHYNATYNKLLRHKKEIIDGVIMENYFFKDTLFF